MRSLLFAPATRPDLVEKLPRSRPDAVVVDLEDAVPASHKDLARGTVASMLEGLRAADPELGIYLRVNSVGTRWFAEDVAEGVSEAATGIVVPKLEEPAQLDVVRDALASAGLAGMRIVVGIESARGIARVEQLLGDVVYAAYFGAEDFAADLGGSRTENGDEVLYARSRFVLAARVGGVIPVDQIVVDVTNADAFLADAQRGRQLGFRGKMCIHPRQVELANTVFGASAPEAERARALLATWEQAAAQGVGAVSFEGSMIDEPALRMARDTLSRAGAGRDA